MTEILKKLLIASLTLLGLSSGEALAISITVTVSGSSEPIPVVGQDLQLSRYYQLVRVIMNRQFGHLTFKMIVILLNF
jgi:hypothetical protein